MSGETDIKILLKEMNPILDSVEYVFCNISQEVPLQEIYALKPLGLFHEVEGVTLILEAAKARQANLVYEHVFQKITLNIHSSLAAVGLTAAISTALAQHNISANVVAGFYHDHIFVPTNQASQALNILNNLG